MGDGRHDAPGSSTQRPLQGASPPDPPVTTDTIGPMNAVRVAALHVSPIRSCAGVALQEMRFDIHGPLDDRRWMRVDDVGFLTQPEMPRLALVRPARTEEGLQVDPPAG